MASGVRFDLDLDTSGLQSKLSTDNWEEHRRGILLAIAEHLVGGLKAEVTANTGRLRHTIRALETGGPGVSVVAGGEEGVDYTLPYLHGSVPHAPGSPDPSENLSLSRWAERTGYPGGFQGIYWSIYHYGTEEHDFVSGPREDTQREAGGIAAQVLRNRGVLE